MFKLNQLFTFKLWTWIISPVVDPPACLFFLSFFSTIWHRRGLPVFPALCLLTHVQSILAQTYPPGRLRSSCVVVMPSFRSYSVLLTSTGLVFLPFRRRVVPVFVFSGFSNPAPPPSLLNVYLCDIYLHPSVAHSLPFVIKPFYLLLHSVGADVLKYTLYSFCCLIIV